MNITNVRAVNIDFRESGNTQGASVLSLGEKGQIITGLISKVLDTISINFSGKEVSVSKSAVHDAKEGEIRKFEITDVSDKGIVLKEVGKTGDNNGILCTSVNSGQIAFSQQLDCVAGKESVHEGDAREQLEGVSGRMTGEDYKKLSEEGFSLETYELERLDRALERIRQQRVFKEQNLAATLENQEEYSKQIEKIMVSNIADNPRAGEVARKLVESNLPVTIGNITKILKTLEQADVASSISDKEMRYLLDNELAPTIENVYQAKYSGVGQSGEVSEDTWKQIQSQVETIIGNSGMEVDETSLNRAKWLFANKLPVTAQTLSSLEDLEKMKTQTSAGNLLDRVISSVEKGIHPKDTLIYDGSLETAKQAVEDFKNISDEALRKASKSGKELNLQELKAAQESVIQTAAVIDNTEFNISLITARRQLEEIRLKMTVEAGQKLVSKGINLNTDELQKIVDGLKELEDQYYKNILKEANAPDNEENVNLLLETTQKVNELKESPNYVLGVTLKQSQLQSVDTLHAVATGMKAQMEKAGQSYEVLMTAPRNDMGDSIEKAFQNIDSILTDLGLEDTKANRRAIKILGYNSMEITKENITEVKAYDNQVNNLMKNLHPAVTVEMIKRGIHPLNTPIEELNRQIRQMKEELGVTEEEKYSKYLWKLEKDGGISEQERTGYIGIYRLLNNVEKTNGAAIGAVLQANQEVNLKNLLTAVRTIKSGGIDQAVNDDFGALKSLTFSKKSITVQIEAAYEQNADSKELEQQIGYINSLLHQVMNEISPNKLEVAWENGIQGALGSSIEKLYERMEGIDENVLEYEYQEQRAFQMRETTSHSGEDLKLLQNYGIPVTINHLTAAQNLLTNEKLLFREIKKKTAEFSIEDEKTFSEAISGFEDALEDCETLQNEYEKASENIQNILNKGYGKKTITSKDIADLKLLGNGIELAKQLSRKEYYEIPLEVEGSITNIRLTVLSDKESGGKVHINVNSKHFGQIESNITIKQSSVKALVLCENREGLKAMEAEKESLTNQINEMGLEIKQLNYGLDREIGKNFFNYSNLNEGQTDTKTLYQVAKAFVKSVRIIEKKMHN